MDKVVLYHNPRWKKSRGAVQLLEESNKEYEVIEYLKSPLSHKQVLDLSIKLGLSPSLFVRKNEADFRLNKLKNIMSDDLKMAKAISDYPKIMERPIAVLGSNAIICRPSEKILDLLTNEDKNESI